MLYNKDKKIITKFIIKKNLKMRVYRLILRF